MSTPFFALCLAGPTGAGKTALALRIASELSCEVVNADSRQLYKDFPLITAQPSAQERCVCPHHLYGTLECRQAADAQEWATKAKETALAIRARGHVPLFVGGTGFYFQTLLRGIADIPPVPKEVHERTQARMQAQGSVRLHEELASVDPEYAAKIHPNDRQRVTRALEVWESSGKTFSWWHKNASGEPMAAGPLLVADTALKDLEEPLRRRIGLMLEAGAMEEAKRALSLCDDETAPGWSGIGCRELFRFLKGKLTFDKTIEEWYKNTRLYAKRQITWFKGRKEAVWVNLAEEKKIIAFCEEEIEKMSRVSFT